MNYSEFEQAKATFRLQTVEKELASPRRKRAEFNRLFSYRNISSMKIDDYVIGKGSKNSFCYWVERSLEELGSIVGAPSKKFGIYYSKKNNGYIIGKKIYGKSTNVAFQQVKKNLLDLIDSGKREDYATIEANPISTMFKGKILALYYPDKYLNIFSEDHLDFYLRFFDLDNEELIKSDPIYKRRKLLEFKNSDKDMRKWSNDAFSVFLWSHYPKTPQAEDDKGSNKRNEVIDFPTTDTFEWINDLQLTKDDKNSYSKRTRSLHSSKDYEKEARKHKRMGDRGEKIVMAAEVDRLMREQGISKKQAEKKVKWRSRESDSYGYDIQSENADGSPRYIEVKATQNKKGDMTFFYTLNELMTAREYKDNYYIYIVYEITTIRPKIWVQQNPFLKDDKLQLTPIQFKVDVRTK